MSKVTVVKKICLLGDATVGKTSLIKKYVHDIFNGAYVATIGTKVTRREMLIRKPEDDFEYHLKLTIWDILGQHTFTSVKATAYRGASGALLVCDVTRPETLMHTKNWVKTLTKDQGKLPIILLANKCDLEEDQKVSESEINDMADKLDIDYWYTSAKTGQNVALAFRNLGEMLIEHRGVKITTRQKKRPKERRMKPTVYTVLDELMDDFCNTHGGQEEGMPFLRKKIAEVDMDFIKPAVFDLRNLIFTLTDVKEGFYGPEEAAKVKKRYLDLIERI